MEPDDSLIDLTPGAFEFKKFNKDNPDNTWHGINGTFNNLEAGEILKLSL